VLVAFAMTYLIRSAAASVRRITWGLGRAICEVLLSSFDAGKRALPRPQFTTY
jgi:hypothetical protein